MEKFLKTNILGKQLSTIQKYNTNVTVRSCEEGKRQRKMQQTGNWRNQGDAQFKDDINKAGSETKVR